MNSMSTGREAVAVLDFWRYAGNPEAAAHLIAPVRAAEVCDESENEMNCLEMSLQ